MSKTITTSIISMQLDSKSYVQKPFPKYLHGLCYRLAGEDFPHEKYTPPSFHPVIKEWKSSQKRGTNAIIQIYSLNEHLTYNMLKKLEEIKVITLGHEEMTLKSFSLEKQDRISLNQEDSPCVPKEFKIVFTTPTVFRTRKPSAKQYETRAYPDVKLFIRSIARNLHILYGVEIDLKIQDRLAEKIQLINCIAYPVQVKIDKTAPYVDSFIGEVHISSRALDDDEKRLFGLLLKTGKYSGVGYKKGYGFGHFQIKRPDVARTAI